MRTILYWIPAAIAIAAPSLAGAHGGGLNAEGCHNERKTGGYHCHRAPAVARVAPQTPTTAPQAVAATAPARPTCYTGPRGGTYTLTASGKKNYGGC